MICGYSVSEQVTDGCFVGIAQVRAARLVYGAQRVVGRQAMRMSATRSVFKVQASASVEEGLGGLEKVMIDEHILSLI